MATGGRCTGRGADSLRSQEGEKRRDDSRSGKNESSANMTQSLERGVGWVRLTLNVCSLTYLYELCFGLRKVFMSLHYSFDQNGTGFSPTKVTTLILHTTYYYILLHTSLSLSTTTVLLQINWVIQFIPQSWN